MARIRSADFENRQAQIAQTASVLFAARGYHATSINDIAKTSGTAKSRLYHYFDSKESVLYFLLKAHAHHLNMSLSSAMQIDATPKNRLQNFTKALLTINIEARNTHTLILNELHELTTAHEQEIRALLRAPIEILYTLLSEINPALTHGKNLRFPSAMLLLGMINWSHVWFRDDGPIDADHYAKMICETFMGGFGHVKL